MGKSRLLCTYTLLTYDDNFPPHCPGELNRHGIIFNSSAANSQIVLPVYKRITIWIVKAREEAWVVNSDRITTYSSHIGNAVEEALAGRLQSRDSKK